ncbi:FBXW5 protein, partial [Columbina picui]|nr:FBXW5 protein [Columbina picui]
PAAISWYDEFQRLYDTIPCVEVQALKEHNDQVLHLSFSHSGCLFASCSKDCTVKVKWQCNASALASVGLSMGAAFGESVERRSLTSEPTSTSASVSPDSLSGTIISSLCFPSPPENFTLLSRVRNKPYDVFGCWLNETNLISGNLHRIGQITSCSVLWLNNAFQVRSLRCSSTGFPLAPGEEKLWRSREPHPPCLSPLTCSQDPELEAALHAISPCSVLRGALSVPLSVAGSADRQTSWPSARPWCAAAALPGQTLRCDPPGLADAALQSGPCGERRRSVVRRERLPLDSPTSSAASQGQLPDSAFCPQGIKRILPHQMTTAGPVLGEERRSVEFFDSLDHVIDVHGHIIGMGLSPDHRYLYVNSRAWPRDCIISDPMQPPPIAEEIDLHVFDLKTMKEVKRPLRAHRAYTPNEECFFIFLDVSRDFVA